ncbi:MAG TPA: hypothetical protein VF544_12465 [Pyrinomonadaceae bacterium]
MKSRRRRSVRHKTERGAALITMLLMSALLLTAGGALILTTAMSAANSHDSTSEMQAYYAAEAGLQATINVLRGNVSPSLTYRDAVTPANSNAAGDPATTQASPFARLSKWLPYDATVTDRVPITTPYSTLNGSAYNAVLTDPDNSSRITFSTTGIFPTSTCSEQKSIQFTNLGVLSSCTNGGSKAKITYNAQASTTVNAYPSIASLLGSFTTDINGGGAAIPAGTPFTLTINQTAPWTATIIINCTVTSGGTTLTNSTSTVDVDFKATTYDNQGTLYTFAANPLRLNTPTGGDKNVAVTIAAPQPRRILVRVNGYGPRGARKQMEMMVGRFLFDYWPSGLLAIRSADDNITPMTFSAGSSAVYSYSGNAPTGGQKIPAIAVTSTVDYTLISNIGASGQVTGNPAAIKVPISSLVPFLQTADEARRTLNKLETAAHLQNRYYTNASPPPDYGTVAEPKFTFMDGNATPDGGAGLLVCTGTVTLNGNDEFKGLMLVLGDGVIVRNGGGNGASLGAFALARFSRGTWGGPFLAPTFMANGGGTSSITFDPSWVEKALLSASRYPIGISEY